MTATATRARQRSAVHACSSLVNANALLTAADASVAFPNASVRDMCAIDPITRSARTASGASQYHSGSHLYTRTNCILASARGEVAWAASKDSVQ